MSPFEPTPEVTAETPQVYERWQAATMHGQVVSVDAEAGTALIHTRLHRGKPDLVFEVKDPSIIPFLASQIGKDLVLEGMGLYREGALIAGKIWEARLGPGPFRGFEHLPPLKLSVTNKQWAEILRNKEADEREGE